MSTEPILSDDPVQTLLAERVGYLFSKLHHRWANESMTVLREAGLGLSGLHLAALTVVDSAAPMSQQALGEYLKKDRTSMVAIVDELEQEGLVERGRNAADRRAYALEVTAKGRRWLARARPLLGAAEERLLSALDPSEREVLVGLLQRVLLSAPPE